MLLGEITGEPIVVVKDDPDEAQLLRSTLDDITQRHHVAKQHWITLRPGGSIDARLVTDS
jgi:predicted DNA-binding protein (MmcQ/YjbR family)